MRPLVWLDLCSGLGGASQPALDRGWRVIRVDIDPRFKPDIVADVRNLPLKPFHVDVLWASPPCQEFSKWDLRCFYPNPVTPDISIAIEILRQIDRLKPNAWFVENVRGARRWFGSLFGPVRAHPANHYLWSNLCVLFPNVFPHKGNGRRHVASRQKAPPKGHSRVYIGHFIGHKNTAPEETAKIPYEIGEAICRAVEARM